jgi:hypothetical protein
LIAVMEAFGMSDPELSATVPVMVPLSLWASRGDKATSKHMAARRNMDIGDPLDR